MPLAIGRVLAVLRRLIDYGKQLADTMPQRAAAPGFFVFAGRFGTADIAAILARITAGLRRAAFLEARLRQRAARGRDLTVASIRLPAARKPRATPPAMPSDAPSATVAEHPLLARLPTEQKIADEVRRRPVGAVIADICRDLGVMPGHLDRAFWEELASAIIGYGGSLLCFFPKLNRPLFTSGPGGHADSACTAAQARPPAFATGPP